MTSQSNPSSSSVPSRLMPESISWCTFPGVDMWQLCSIALYLYKFKEAWNTATMLKNSLRLYLPAAGVPLLSLFLTCFKLSHIMWNDTPSQRISKHSGSLKFSHRLIHMCSFSYTHIQLQFQYMRPKNALNHSHWRVYEQHHWDRQLCSDQSQITTKWSQEKLLLAAEIFSSRIDLCQKLFKSKTNIEPLASKWVIMMRQLLKTKQDKANNSI